MFVCFKALTGMQICPDWSARMYVFLNICCFTEQTKKKLKIPLKVFLNHCRLTASVFGGPGTQDVNKPRQH